MGEREMLLVLGAMFFFSMTNLSMNRFCLNNNEVMMKSEFDYYAISLAQRIIEEVKTRQFDANLSDPPNSFDSPYSMGHNQYESYPNFNDVDDYNGEVLDNDDLGINPPVDYTVSIQVVYVNENNPDVRVYSRTFFKKMTVTVTSDYMTSPVSLSHVFAYYEF